MIAVAVRELLDRPEFGSGLAWGILLGVFAGLFAVLWQLAWQKPAPLAGVAVALAFIWATHGASAVPPNVKWGLLLLAAAGAATGFLVSLWPPLLIAGVWLALPGASVLTTNTDLPTPRWVSTLVIVTVTVGGTLVADFDRRHVDRGWAPVLFAVSMAGVYFVVPDTERAMVLFGAALPIALLGWPVPLASLGAVGAYPCVGALAWVAAFDGRGRLTALIGGVACLGLLVVEPIAHTLRRQVASVVDVLRREWFTAVIVGFWQLVLVFGAARVAGTQEVVQQGAIFAITELAAAVLLLTLLKADQPEDTPAPDSG